MDHQRLTRFRVVALAARRLTVLRPIVADAIGRSFVVLVDLLADPSSTLHQVLDGYGKVFELLADSPAVSRRSGDAWQNHLIQCLIDGECPFADRVSRVATTRDEAPQLGASLWASLRHDLRALQALYCLDAATVRKAIAERLGDGGGAAPDLDVVAWDDLTVADTAGEASAVEVELQSRFAGSADWGELAELLAHHYAHHGAGLFARFRAFRWTRLAGGRLEGISEPDPVRLEQLIGYARERATLVRNTEHFLAGYPANNVLLYGDRGTGKSSSVKALLQAFGERGLRLVEIHKDDLADLPLLLRQLRGRPERFIIFIDDLSFDEDETSYKNLKALLEGSLEARPANVLLYATSNRRHLVQERFSDRASPASDEIHAQDTMQEKLSLSDRFGITIIFASPDQDQYLAIVDGLATQRQLPIAPDDLRRSALLWATRHNGRSGRTARQFIDYLTAELALSARSGDILGKEPPRSR